MAPVTRRFELDFLQARLQHIERLERTISESIRAGLEHRWPEIVRERDLEKLEKNASHQERFVGRPRFFRSTAVFDQQRNREERQRDYGILERLIEKIQKQVADLIVSASYVYNQVKKEESNSELDRLAEAVIESHYQPLQQIYLLLNNYYPLDIKRTMEKFCDKEIKDIIQKTKQIFDPEQIKEIDPHTEEENFQATLEGTIKEWEKLPETVCQSLQEHKITVLQTINSIFDPTNPCTLRKTMTASLVLANIYRFLHLASSSGSISSPQARVKQQTRRFWEKQLESAVGLFGTLGRSVIVEKSESKVDKRSDQGA